MEIVTEEKGKGGERNREGQVRRVTLRAGETQMNTHDKQDEQGGKQKGMTGVRERGSKRRKHR